VAVHDPDPRAGDPEVCGERLDHGRVGEALAGRRRDGDAQVRVVQPLDVGPARSRDDLNRDPHGLILLRAGPSAVGEARPGLPHVFPAAAPPPCRPARAAGRPAVDRGAVACYRASVPRAVLSDATFSIVGCDLATGDLGVAVATRRPAVGSRVPFVEPGVGAVAAQAEPNRKLGPWILDAIGRGTDVEAAVEGALARDPERESRQVLALDARGRGAGYTGRAPQEWKGHRVGPGFVAGGNILAGAHVVAAMAEAFTHTPGELVDRLLAALAAGDAAGGDRRGKQSAAVLVRRPGLDPYVDLRVDDHPDPVAELARVFRVYDAAILHPQGLHAPA